MSLSASQDNAFLKNPSGKTPPPAPSAGYAKRYVGFLAGTQHERLALRSYCMIDNVFSLVLWDRV